MKFLELARVFNKIERTSSRIAITELLAELFKKATAREAGIICYLSLGKLYPPYRESQFNIAQKLMVPVVAKLLDRPEEIIKKEEKQVGDIGTIVADGEWEQINNELSVIEVYDKLAAMQKIAGTGSLQEKANALYDLLCHVDPLSAKYIVRIVLGKLRLGFSDMTIVDALSWMETGDKSLRPELENAYNISADIGLIARTLKEGGMQAIEKMRITVGIPIRPAAAERLPTAKAIFEKLGPSVAQPKLDGFRLQIHLDNTSAKPIVHFFSRNLKDMSAMFPDLVEALLKLKVKTLICEGEAIVYDPNTDAFLPFQETVKRKRKHGIEEMATEFPLRLYIFDILYLNGKSLLGQPHNVRYKTLQKIMPTKGDSPVQVIEEKQIKSAKELEDYFLAAIAEGLEGIVVKRSDAIYQPGKRNFNWIKLKRQEEGHIEDTIDCVILGYYAGSGKRAAFGIGAFLVGVFNKKEDRFETVAKVGTGLTDQEWIDLKKRLDAIKRAQKPSNVISAKELYPDVWVSPDIVCQIRADEITKSPTHAAGKDGDELGMALRFPRLMGYREDKSPEDATSVAELKSMFKHQTSRK